MLEQTQISIRFQASRERRVIHVYLFLRGRHDRSISTAPVQRVTYIFFSFRVQTSVFYSTRDLAAFRQLVELGHGGRKIDFPRYDGERPSRRRTDPSWREKISLARKQIVFIL